MPRYCFFSPKFQLCFWWTTMFKNNWTIWWSFTFIYFVSLFLFHNQCSPPYICFPFSPSFSFMFFLKSLGFPGGSVIKNPPAILEMRIQSLGWEYLLEKEMATHSSTLAWQIPWMEEPGGLPSMGSHGVGHDWSDLAAALAADIVTYNFSKSIGKSLQVFAKFLNLQFCCHYDDV